MKRCLYIFVIGLIALLMLSCEEGSTEPKDDQAPIVMITYPANNTEFEAGVSVNITAEATDNETISNVKFYIDGSLFFTDINSPYEIEWDTTNLIGSHAIYAKAVDGSENMSISDLISVHISEISTNHNPIINSILANPSTIVIGNTSNIICNAIDVDGDSLIYSWSVDEGSIGGNGNEVTYYATDVLGLKTITCLVSDGNGGEDIGDVNVEVIAMANTPPEIICLFASLYSVPTGGKSTLSCNAIDEDGDDLIYEWISNNGSIVENGSSATFNAPSSNETYSTITCMVYDGQGGSAIETENITISNGTDPLVDIDGNVYQTIQIGNQTWMAENLKVTHYRNGDQIPSISNNSEWVDLSTGACCSIPYNYSYGKLYNGYAVFDSRNIAPIGWHVPTDEDIMELEVYLGMSETQVNTTQFRGTNQGSKLAGNEDLWSNGNLENDLEFGASGFNLLPSGYRDYSTGSFYGIELLAYCWTSTEYYSDSAWCRSLGCTSTKVNRIYIHKRSGYAIRCIKD